METFPVGHPGLQFPFGFFVAPGIVTTSAVSLVPFKSYRVEVPLLLLAIQKSCPGRIEIPQGFKSCGSVVVATPEVLETRLVWKKPACWARSPDGSAASANTLSSKKILFK